jgi:uncharacterized protein (DUF1015 family)
MSRIYPFQALRPVPEAAARVAAVPYDVVNTEEARALAAGNGLSFLHVSRPEIDLRAGTDPHADVVYDKAVENFVALRSNAPLVVEDAPGLYVYRLTMGSHVQAGVAACFSLDEYERDRIKKHEKTRPDKEDDRTRHMIAIRAQTGPVFLTYKASPAVDEAVTRVVKEAPLFDFVAPDRIRHEIWRVAASEHHHIMSAFAAIAALYIADGHHRAASAARARAVLRRQGSVSGSAFQEYDTVLAVAFPDDQMQVLPYHRVVRDLNGLSPSEFLERLSSRVGMTKSGMSSPREKGAVGMYLGEQWWTLRLVAPSENATRSGQAPEAQLAAQRAGTALDVSRLQDEVLSPVLGIHDVRTDNRIDFVGGIRGTAELERLVDSGTFAVAFSLYPVSVDDLMRIADAGGIMPPKSTWFEPKLRDGLLSHLI